MTITSRFRRSLVGLSLGLCTLFTMLTVLLVYIIEDQVFINQLRSEQQVMSQLNSNELTDWQPRHPQMQHHRNLESLPVQLLDSIREAPGIYEYFSDELSLFVMKFEHPADLQWHYIVYDVSELLAVRDSKKTLFVLIAVTSLIIVLVAIWLAGRLVKSTMQPLRQLTDHLQADDHQVLGQELTTDLAGDEVGLLVQELEAAIGVVRQLTQKEFEFNRGVSHELRTPLQVANNAMALLAVNRQTSDTAALKRLNRAIKDLERITNAFLWLASHNRNEMTVADVSQVISDIKNRYATSHPMVSLQILAENPSNYPIPAAVLDVLVDNLIRNAIQHGDGQMIEAHFTQDGWSVVNSIDPKATHQPGHGMGLAIVQGICDQLGWQLSVSQEPQTMLVKVDFS